MEGSIWCDEGRKSHPSLEGERRCDVLVVGAGIAGILTAYMLKMAGVDCLLVEAGRILDGVTHNTTAKITLQHGCIYDDIIQRYGTDKAAMYLDAAEDAIRTYRTLAEKYPCDFADEDAYVYTMTDRARIEREVEALNLLGCKAEFTSPSLLPFATLGAARVKNQAQFDPLKLLIPLSRELTVYENTRVIEIGKNEVRTERGRIKADSVIIATHFPILNKHGAYFLKMYQNRSYVIALEGAGDVGGMYIDEHDGGLSLRNHGDLLLLGGGSHRTGKRGGGWSELREVQKLYYPDSREVAYWSAQDCMSLDRIPYIGRYFSGATDLYVATGFNKWGMTGAMTAARILTDALTGRENMYADVFAPDRSIMHRQLLTNAVESVINLVTPTVPRCPHLGCALKYNATEHSWDCPCHGSRFAEDGTLLDGPANADKRSLGDK